MGNRYEEMTDEEIKMGVLHGRSNLLVRVAALLFFARISVVEYFYSLWNKGIRGRNILPEKLRRTQ